MLLMTNRDETRKRGQVLQAAGQKAPPEEICKLFKVFLTAEGKMLQGLEQHGATCSVPVAVIDQVKVQHRKASQMAEQVCVLAARDAPLRHPRHSVPRRP